MNIVYKHTGRLVAWFFLLVLTAGWAVAADEAGEASASSQHKLIGVAAPDAGTRQDSLARDHWFPQAGLGMFIHWGLASAADFFPLKC